MEFQHCYHFRIRGTLVGWNPAIRGPSEPALREASVVRARCRVPGVRVSLWTALVCASSALASISFRPAPPVARPALTCSLAPHARAEQQELTSSIRDEQSPIFSGLKSLVAISTSLGSAARRQVEQPSARKRPSEGQPSDIRRRKWPVSSLLWSRSRKCS